MQCHVLQKGSGEAEVQTRVLLLLGLLEEDMPADFLVECERGDGRRVSARLFNQGASSFSWQPGGVNLMAAR